MDLGGEALGSYKARQGGCTQIQVSDIDGRLSQVFLNFPLYLSSSSTSRIISSVSFRRAQTKLISPFEIGVLDVAWSFPK
jgi:hypothetical protein